MKRSILAFFAGLLFAVGLVVAGMTQPAKVIGFLDFFGDWDPSLAFVMGGAAGVYFIAFRLIRGRAAPILADRFQLPTRRDLTPALVVGAGLFGIGWGLGGYCPGPGLTGVGGGSLQATVFVAAMAAGMVIYRILDVLRAGAKERREARTAPQGAERQAVGGSHG